VPLVEASAEDFKLFSGLIELHPQTHNLTLTKSPNPWKKMFQSIPYLIFFRIITPLWSCGCLALCTRLLRTSNKIAPPKPVYQTKFECLFRICRQQFTLKRVCLGLQAVTHLSRVALFTVDPIISCQILPYLALQLLMACIVDFEISTNVLLAFVVRELTNAKVTINVMQKVLVAYCIMCLFIAVDFWLAVYAALFIDVGAYAFIIRVMFMLVMNVFLGIWYLWQAVVFSRRFAAREQRIRRENRQRLTMTRITRNSAIGMITFGLLLAFLGVPDVYGKPWGFFFVWMALVTVFQLTSFSQILLFGGLALDKKMVLGVMKRMTSRRATGDDYEL
jgi:hypothetical protein